MKYIREFLIDIYGNQRQGDRERLNEPLRRYFVGDRSGKPTLSFAPGTTFYVNLKGEALR